MFGAAQSAAHLKSSLYSKSLMNRCTDWLFEGNCIAAYVCGCVDVCVQGQICWVNSYQIENSLQDRMEH